MKKYKFLISLLLFLCCHTLHGQVVDAQDVKNQDIRKQLSLDKTLIPMGKGGLFVPYLYDRKLEPAYTIFREKQYVRDAKPGRRISLDPGSYTLYIGSGAIDTRMRIRVKINEERISVVMPRWSALIVHVKDENNNDIQKGYQIINEENKLNIGSGRGADIMKGEKPEIWLLQPGLYRVMRKGESSESFRNFVTVRTRKGKVTHAVLYFDEKLDQLLAGGETGLKEGLSLSGGKWRLQSIISGTFSFLNDGYFNDDNTNKNSYSLGATFNITANYEDDNFLFINTFDIYEQFQKPADYRMFDFTRDIGELESLFIYRINRFFGPYLSLRARTSFFLQYRKVGNEDNVTYYKSDNGRLSELNKDEYFIYANYFSPTILTESIGMNFEYEYGTMLSIFARSGWGLRQNISPKMYDVSAEVIEDDQTGTAEHLFHRVDRFDQSYGPELTADITFVPFSFIEIKEEFEMLVPVQADNVGKKINYMLTSTVSVWISSFATIQYEFLIERDPVIMSSVKRQHTLNVQLFYRLL